FPHEPGGPQRLTRDDFQAVLPAEFDCGDQAARRAHRSWWRRLLPSLAAVIVIRRQNLPASYQSMLAVAQLPRQGLVYPRAEYLLALYDVGVDPDVEV